VGCDTGRFCTSPPYAPYRDVHGVEHAGTNHGEVFAAPPPPPATIQDGRFDQTGLGERLLRQAGGGAVTYIGCNTGAQPCAVTLLEGFIQALAAPTRGRLGDAWCEALAHYYETEGLPQLTPTRSWYPPSIFFQA
jgi:Peptidase family C25